MSFFFLQRNPEDPVFQTTEWKCFLKLKMFVELAVNESWFDEDIDILENSTVDYLQQRMNLRDEQLRKGKISHLSCKHLWTLHYKYHINMLGSLSLLETNIPEIKNGKIRQLSQKAHQTRNVLLTIASRESKQNAVRMFCKGLKTIDGKEEINAAQVTDPDDISILKLKFRNLDNLFFYSRLETNGHTFRTDGKMLLIFHLEEIVFLGIAKLIIFNTEDETYSFLCEEATAQLIPHLGLYKVDREQQCFVANFCDLSLGRPLQIYEKVFSSDKILLEVVSLHARPPKALSSPFKLY